MNILVVMDPIEGINYKKDSTLAMLWAASRRGHALYYARPDQLYLRDGQLHAIVQPLEVFQDPQNYYQLGEKEDHPVTDFDVILNRKDPPFDLNFVYLTYLLQRARNAGVWVINDPESVRDCNEKLFATEFPHLMVPTLVTSQESLLRDFIREHGDVIFKPLDGMGGMGIFRLTDNSPNIGATIELLTGNGQHPIMAQKYIPEIVQGDKRILMINGEPVAYALARIPAQGETRGNLAAGGRGEARELTERDREIAAQVGPVLREKGLVFVGLDVIGDYVTEVNVTSPTCIREIDDQKGTHIADDFIQFLEQEQARRKAAV